MKKRSLLAIVVGLVAGGAMAQSPVMLDGGNDGAILEPYTPQPSSQTSNKKVVVNEWYNFADASSNGGISYTRLSNATLFPDSTVKQLYGSSGGGTELGYVGRHNVGQVFDPKSFYYTNILTEHNPYTVDSVAIGYLYSHNIPGTVDTIELRVYSGSGISVGNLVDGNGNVLEATAWIGYNRTFGVGTGASQTLRFTLDETDSDTSQYQIRPIALNQPESIGRNGLIALSYRFIPGYDWDFGDTIQQDWTDPEPTKKLNHLIAFVLRDNAKTAENSYNHGLAVLKFQKYGTSTNWDAEFIPGDAWNDFTEQVYASFKINSPNVGIDAAKKGITSKVYPNPSNGSDVLNIDYSVVNAGDINIQIFDLQGRLVKNVLRSSVEPGNYQATTNIADLDNGMYVYTITHGATTTSGKFSVVK